MNPLPLPSAPPISRSVYESLLISPLTITFWLCNPPTQSLLQFYESLISRLQLSKCRSLVIKHKCLSLFCCLSLKYEIHQSPTLV